MLSIVGILTIILPPIILIILNIKIERGRKSFIHYIETEKGPILSTKKTRKSFEIKEHWRKIRNFFEKYIIIIIIALVAIGVMLVMIRNYAFKPSYLTAETAISEGCAILNMGGCEKDPSKIIVDYDVNGDEIRGGVDDSLSNLLENYNCTGNCIKRRCGCPGY